MSIAAYYPIFDKLTPDEQQLLQNSAVRRTVPAGMLLHNGSEECMGLLLICSGQLRAYITSDEGREITLYRLFDRDICLLSASCVMSDIRFELMITAEKETDLWVIPPYIYKALMERSAVAANYSNALMSSRFTDVMWLLEQIMWKSMDKRLAAFLLEESTLEGTQSLKITHEQIANHMGTAREVVTRMLKYFQTENMVTLTRGTIHITDPNKLETLAE